MGVVSLRLSFRRGNANEGVVAVTPDEAAKSLVEWTEKLDMSKSGEYWAPRGPSKLPFLRKRVDLLTFCDRGYWNCGSNTRKEPPNTITITMVDNLTCTREV